MFRHILAVLFIFANLSSAKAYSCYDTPSSSSFADEEHVMPAGDDRWTHWPWSLAQPFPWLDIQGTWKVEQEDYTSYFIFKVVQQKNGRNQIKVTQIDGSTCQEIGRGVGVETGTKGLGKGALVYAQMTRKSNGKTYRLSLTAFKRSDSPLPPLQGNVYTESMIVLSMGEMDQQNLDDMVHMQIIKVSSQMTQKTCIQDAKN